MPTKKCSRCDREVFSPNDTECDYCLGKIILAGDDRKLFRENSTNEKSFCTNCGERNYNSEPICEFCGGIVRIAGSGNVPQSANMLGTSKVTTKKLPEEPAGDLSQQVTSLLAAQKQTNEILRAFAGFFLYSIHTTLIFIFLIINALKNDSTGGLWVSWLIYFGAMGFFVYRAKEQIGV